jgi:hypothetical protein
LWKEKATVNGIRGSSKQRSHLGSGGTLKIENRETNNWDFHQDAGSEELDLVEGSAPSGAGNQGVDIVEGSDPSETEKNLLAMLALKKPEMWEHRPLGIILTRHLKNKIKSFG